MGLAPYGERYVRGSSRLETTVHRDSRSVPIGSPASRLSPFEFHLGVLGGSLSAVEAFGEPLAPGAEPTERHMAVARGAQPALEALLRLGERAFSLSGGQPSALGRRGDELCGNGRMERDGPFESVDSSSAGDGDRDWCCALGLALH